MPSRLRLILRRPLALVGVALVLIHLLMALSAPWWIAHDPTALVGPALEPPGEDFLFGTDELGRDFLSRVVMGGRVAILVAFSAGLIAALGGGLVGLAAAYYRGWFVDGVSRLVELKLAIPSILFVSLFVTGFGQSGGGAKLWTLMAMPSAAGLFHKVITMSGQHVTAMGPQHAELRIRAYLDRLDLTPDRAGELATLPAARLVEALSLEETLEKGAMPLCLIQSRLCRRSYACNSDIADAHALNKW